MFGDDAIEIVGQLGADRVITSGWWGGSPHALSLGSATSELCKAVITIGSVAPYDVHDLNWTDGMGPEYVEEFSIAHQGGEQFDAY